MIIFTWMLILSRYSKLELLIILMYLSNTFLANNSRLGVEKMIKEELRKIVENGYAVPEGADEYPMVQKVIQVLGSIDPELRDDLGYDILQNWLVEQSLLTKEQLEDLLVYSISDEMLLKQIGESGTDSVFLRTFSSLLIALLLIRDNRDHFLQETTFQNVMNTLVNYCKQERDFRGYVAEKGWAHAAAHVSDAIDECVRSRFTRSNDCQFLWSGLRALLENAPDVFNTEEDERIATAVTAMVELKKVSIKTICEWLNLVELPAEKEIRFRYRRINFKLFVRCLFMRLKEKGLLGEEQEIISVEHRFNPRYYNL